MSYETLRKGTYHVYNTMVLKAGNIHWGSQNFFIEEADELITSRIFLSGAYISIDTRRCFSWFYKS